MEINIIEIIGIIIMLFIVLGVHELGHLLVGLIQGFRLELFVIGPLGIKRENNKINIYLNKNIQFFGGVTAVFPIDDKPENSKKFANMVLAGPIASLIFSILFIYLYTFKIPFFSMLFFVGGFTSFCIFLATTIPNKTGMFFTDRKRYQRLTSNGKENIIELAVIRIMGIYGRDNSYINSDPNDIEKMISDENYKYLGLFVKLCYQFNKNGVIDANTKKEYENISKLQPKTTVDIFNKELEKLEK